MNSLRNQFVHYFYGILGLQPLTVVNCRQWEWHCECECERVGDHRRPPQYDASASEDSSDEDKMDVEPSQNEPPAMEQGPTTSRVARRGNPESRVMRNLANMMMPQAGQVQGDDLFDGLEDNSDGRFNNSQPQVHAMFQLRSNRAGPSRIQSIRPQANPPDPSSSHPFRKQPIRPDFANSQCPNRRRAKVSYLNLSNQQLCRSSAEAQEFRKYLSNVAASQDSQALNNQNDEHYTISRGRGQSSRGVQTFNHGYPGLSYNAYQPISPENSQALRSITNQLRHYTPQPQRNTRRRSADDSETPSKRGRLCLLYTSDAADE